jgi:hypothetical protein
MICISVAAVFCSGDLGSKAFSWNWRRSQTGKESIGRSTILSDEERKQLIAIITPKLRPYVGSDKELPKAVLETHIAALKLGPKE